MKIIIASDIHGSLTAAKALLAAAEREGAEQIALLGDVYYHGPRNPLPDRYDPKGVAALLNGRNDLIVVKGNCDSEVDGMISSFRFAEDAYLFVGKKIFLTHGHVYNIDNLPAGCDAVFYGHVHYGFICEKDGVVVANPGSVSLPKNNSEKSYLLLDGTMLYLKNLEGKILEKRGL